MTPKISVHHIGGRGGDRGFPVRKPFEKDIVNVLYDADKDCVDDIFEKVRNHGSELHVFPYCVGGVDGKASFNCNLEPYTSSLLSINPDFNDCYCFSTSYDSIIGEDGKTVKTLDINTTTLDTILRTNNVPKPDFLSIDTQGSEYEILQGAGGCLKKDLLAVVVEVEFKPIYKNQKVFGEISELLTSRGFEFIKFVGASTVLSPYRAPIGLRGEGHLFSTDALFFKKGDLIGNKTFDDFVQLIKLAFFSITFHQLETGLQYLSQAKGIPNAQEMQEKLAQYSYARFLFELDKRAGAMKKEYPPSFGEKFTVQASYARFIADKKNEKFGVVTLREKMVATIKRNESLYKALWRARREFRSVLHAGLIGMRAVIDGFKFSLTRDSAVEQLLREYEFDELYRIVKLKRLIQYEFRKCDNK